MRDLIEALIAARIVDEEAALAEAGARHAKIDRERLRDILRLVALVIGDDPAASEKATADLEAMSVEPIVTEAITTSAAVDFGADSFLLEAIEPEGKVIDVLAIRSGMSKNRRRYRPEVLRAAVAEGKFEGARSFASEGPDHDRAKRGVKSLVGWWSNARFGAFTLPNGQVAEGVAAHYHPTDPALRAMLVEAFRSGKPDLIGFSIFGDGPLARLPDGAFDVSRIDAIESIDPVISPAAGGQPIRLVASTEGSVPMNCDKCGKLAEAGHICERATPDVAKLVEAQVEAALGPIRTASLVEAAIAERAGLPDVTKARIRAVASGQTLDAEAVKALVEAEVAYVATIAPARVTGAGSGIEPGQDQRAKMVEAISDVLDGKGSSIRRVYEDLTGDRFMTGKLAESSRITEALSESAIVSTTFPLLTQEAMHKALLKEYAKPGADDWRKIVSTITPVSDFRDRKGVRIGGYGDLPIVAERGDYLAIAEPGEESVTIPKVAKRGGLEDLTIEAIANDDVRAFRRIPVSLARAAKRTLAKGVWGVLSTNMVYTGDTVALFAVGHGNLGTAAFDATSVEAMRLAMAAQAEQGSAEPLGIRPKFLVIPEALRRTAWTLLNSEKVVGSANNDPNFVAQMALEPIVVPFLTDANNWYTVADPTQYDTIEVSFFNGQEEPELLLQDQPNIGDNFVKDVLTYKIRHIWSVGLLDTKPFYGAIVA